MAKRQTLLNWEKDKNGKLNPEKKLTSDMRRLISENNAQKEEIRRGIPFLTDFFPFHSIFYLQIFD